MRDGNLSVTFLGTRGSVPVNGKEYERYGGATSCVRVLAGNEEIYLDAGSGIVQARPEQDTHITVLFSHLHLDHVQGLPFFPALAQAGRPIALYAADREGISGQEAIDRLFSPPLWPCRISDYPAEVSFHPLQSRFSIGSVPVTTMPSFHPGGATIYRLAYQGKSLVYATDFEHTGEKIQELIRFAQDADLLIYDGQYTQEEYEKRKGYGHSTASVGGEIAAAARVKQFFITHHDPRHTDDWFMQMERQNPQITYAKDGEEILL
ncbi:MAG: MBL fold metallo-hydrolase [Lachnospiraceae bacterium]|nr:MBL fold metallo-hydrolase [Lachnospiraceae bacterium]